jgi:hypothetical protein
LLIPRCSTFLARSGPAQCPLEEKEGNIQGQNTTVKVKTDLGQGQTFTGKNIRIFRKIPTFLEKKGFSLKTVNKRPKGLTLS